MPKQQSPLTLQRTVLKAVVLDLSIGLLSAVHAQTSTVGTISGTVKDQNGAGIPKAEVVITEMAAREFRLADVAVVRPG